MTGKAVNERAGDMARIVPSDMAARLSTPLALTSPTEGWGDVVLQRFDNVPPVVDLPGMRDEVLVCHLAGPFLAETGCGTSRFERQWIDASCIGVNPAGLPVRRVIKGKPAVVLLHLPPPRSCAPLPKRCSMSIPLGSR